MDTLKKNKNIVIYKNEEEKGERPRYLMLVGNLFSTNIKVFTIKSSGNIVGGLVY